jgi:excisionase family DNA binding protein
LGAAEVEERPVYTVEEVAKLLRIARTLAYEAVRQGDIPTLRIGRRILVTHEALQLMLSLSPEQKRRWSRQTRAPRRD